MGYFLVCYIITFILIFVNWDSTKPIQIYKNTKKTKTHQTIPKRTYAIFTYSKFRKEKIMKVDYQDIVGKSYPTYKIIEYVGKNASGTHTYKVKFTSGGTAIRTRASVLKGTLQDRTIKKAPKPRPRPQNTHIPSGYQKDISKDITVLYGKLDTTKTLVLDQSSNNTGYAVVVGKKITCYGTITTKKVSLAQRIHILVGDIAQIVRKHNIGTILIEGVYLGKNVETYSILCNVIGGIMLYCAANNLNLLSIPNPVWRAALEIKGGRTNCKQSSIVLAEQYVGKDIGNNDISDAINMAQFICEEPNNTIEW